jgi:hypothetical protein
MKIDNALPSKAFEYNFFIKCVFFTCVLNFLRNFYLVILLFCVIELKGILKCLNLIV